MGPSPLNGLSSVSIFSPTVGTWALPSWKWAAIVLIEHSVFNLDRCWTEDNDGMPKPFPPVTAYLEF